MIVRFVQPVKTAIGLSSQPANEALLRKTASSVVNHRMLVHNIDSQEQQEN